MTRKESIYRVASKLPAALAAITFMVGVLAGGGTAAWAQTDEEVALSLASLLRASRAVISKNQKHINNPCIGDKGLSAVAVVAKAKENYKKAAGGDLDAIDPASPHGKLIKAELQAITDVMNEAQGLINEKGKGFKGFIPAVYGRLVTQKFNPAAAALRLTAPKNYVRNQANSPDKWEDNVIESKFKAAGHPKGQHVSEMTTFKGKPAFRLILPEYYKESCLACHGEPKGEKDITGGKKEGAKLGDLGGAISVVIFK